MMRLTRFFQRLNGDRQGTVGLEFAMAIPVLVSLLLGILQFAMFLHAGGAMRNAMGEGLRLAKVNPTATAEQVYTRTKDKFVGVDQSGITKLEFTRGKYSNGASYGRLVMSYKLEPVMPFMPIPPLVIEEEKEIYLQT
ncbi:TadE/TadG family type IV pilus assembly protein [Altererythrobacter sp.]|uniref:TadE/TadG family type IV pilus assembly protein n=1 Tax=Altererythrobacter sp. TaxID=1872480 RepID=UPI003D075B6B